MFFKRALWFMKKINELFKPVNLTKGSVWKAIAGFSVITSKHSGQKNIGAIRRSPATQIVLSFIIGVILTAVSILSINPLPIGRKNQRGGYPLRKRLSLLRLIFILSPRRIVCAPQFFTRHRKIAVSAGCGGGRTDSENRFMPAVARGAQPRTDRHQRRHVRAARSDVCRPPRMGCRMRGAFIRNV